MTAIAIRPRWLALVYLAIIATCLAIVGYRGALRSVNALLPVEVRVTAKPDQTLAGVALETVSIDGQAGPAIPVRPGHWRLGKAPVRELALVLATDWRDWLAAVEIAIGERHYRFDAEALARDWRRRDRQAGAAGAVEHWWGPAETLRGEGRVGTATALLNGPGDGDLAFRALTFPLLLVAGLGLLVFGPGRWLGRAEQAGRPLVPTTSGDPARLIWPAFGLGVVAAALFLVEATDSYYFAQDDNLVQFLPVMLEGCAQLNHDYWPDYNPYQLLGAPMASLGIYALSYPPLWLSCLVADGILGLDVALLEVYAGLHLGLGFIATYALGRSQGLSATLAVALALSFMLSGFFLIGGRSWHYMLPVALWLPALLLSAATLARTTRPWRWIGASGLAIGLFFHAGNAQMWSYGVLAWAAVIGLGCLGRHCPPRRLAWAVGAFVIGLGVAAPLLVPQFVFVQTMLRQAAAGNGIWNGLPALLLPYPLVDLGHPNGWGSAGFGSMSPFYYSGTILTVAGAVAVTASLAQVLRYRLQRPDWHRRCWAILALVALWLAIGEAAGLWSLLAGLPVFHHFTHPFKLLPYLVLFLNLAGAVALMRWLPRRFGWHLAVALGVAGLMLFNTGLARQAFHHYGDDPFPALPAPIAQALRAEEDGLGPRLLSVAPFRSPEIGYAASLAHNLSTRQRFPALDGYGSMLWFSPGNRAALARMADQPEAARRAYGVRWLLRWRGGAEADGRSPRTSPMAEAYAPAFAGAPVAASAGDLVLYDLGPADPLAFLAERPQEALAVRAEGPRLVVELPPANGSRTVVLNFLRRPGSHVSADGETLDVGTDAWGRVRVEVPPGAQSVVLGHDGGWGRGLFFAVVLILVGTAIAVVALARDPDLQAPKGEAGDEG